VHHRASRCVTLCPAGICLEKDNGLVDHLPCCPVTLRVAAILQTMNVASRGNAAESGDQLTFDDEKRLAILTELERILAAEAFRTSKRSRQFLDYVVRQTLEGKGELLKERTIGADVFDRGPEGISTENSLVRKQAGEIRRRLDDYYKGADAEDSPARILLPVGSYVPEFCFHTDIPCAAQPTPQLPLETAVSPAQPRSPAARPAIHFARWAAAVVAVVAAVGIGIWAIHSRSAPFPLFARFWEPVSASSESAVVCIAKPVVYIPSREFFWKYSDAHNRDFGLQWQRLNQRLPRDLDMAPKWSDMQVQEDYGIARGDAEAAYQMATLFTHLGKSSHLRIGEECSLADLRSAPVTLIGAYNNRWTIELMSALHFRFSEEHGGIAIEEQAPNGQVWKPEWNSSGRPSPWNASTELQPVTDYAIVSRIKDSQTGQHLTILAGMTGPGTQAAAELVSSPEKLEQVLREIPPGWDNKNLQIIIRVNIPDGITPTTPQVVANHSW